MRSFSGLVLAVAALSLLSATVWAQDYRSPMLGPSVGLAPQTPPPKPPDVPKILRKDPPPPGIVVMRGILQNQEGDVTHLREKAEVESVEYLLTADEIDYNQELGIAEARGHVHFTNFVSAEQLWADRIDFNFKESSGTFYKVHGSAYGKIDQRPGILTTGNPFLFEGDWAEKFKDRYVLHDGLITNCEMPHAWWTLRAPTIDLIPNDRALAYKSWLRLKSIPLLYSPVFYKDLSSNARRSGFLTPNIGTSSRRGFMLGLGYFWAINRSYDLTYRPQYFTQRGLANTVDFRGKPTETSDFNVYVYGIKDRGYLEKDGTRTKQGGYIISVTGKAQLPGGFYARGVFNYLSSLTFRQAFTESFNEAVVSEVNSVGFVKKDWSSYSLNLVFTRQQNFQSLQPGDTILVQKLPQIEFDSRDQQINKKVLPIWVSWDTSAGLVRRTQPLFQTRQSVQRFDAQPRIMTALHWKDIHLIPAFSLRETYYGASFLTAAEQQSGKEVTGKDINRFTREFSADLILPTLERVYDAPKWIGSKLKHTIEPRASFRTVSGVQDFNRIIRFDEMDLLSNTTEVEVSLANRLWAKTKAGTIYDFFNWELRQKRYLDPGFGGALIPGQRNVFLTSTDLTPYAFLDQLRNYSPVVSSMRIQPRPGFAVEWRDDYDPLRGKITNSSLTADARVDNYFVSLGHNKVSCVPLVGVDPGQRDQFCADAPSGQLLSPPSNQLRAMVGLGQENKRGWNTGVLVIYDYKTATMQYINTQLTYNTSCCAFSGQYRRFNIGTRDDYQVRVAFVIANIGSFGTLKRQERLF